MGNKKEYTGTTKAYYNSRFGNNFQAELNEEEHLRWSVIEKKIQEVVLKNKISNTEILDFGCGNGRFSFLMSKYGEVTGLDYAEKAIQTAKNKFPNIQFHTFDASSSLVPDFIKKQFDIIVSTEVIEHLIEQDQYLQNIHQLLKPNGVLILTTPNQKWFDQYFEYGKKQSHQPYEFWLNLGQLRSKLSKLGCSIEYASTFRSRWMFRFKTFGWLKILGNRYFSKVLELLRLKEIFFKIADRLGLGIYLIIVARKQSQTNTK